MSDIEELERAAKKAAAASREAEEKLRLAREAENAARMEPLKALVVRAHAALCQWNHTDGCSWGYEEDSKNPWGCGAHSRWLNHYDRMINGNSYKPPVCSIVEATTIIEAIEQLKPKVKTALSLLRGGMTP